MGFIVKELSAQQLMVLTEMLSLPQVAEYIQDYPTKYHYASHEVIAGAVDEKDNLAFSFWLDTVRSRA